MGQCDLRNVLMSGGDGLRIPEERADSKLVNPDATSLQTYSEVILEPYRPALTPSPRSKPEHHSSQSIRLLL